MEAVLKNVGVEIQRYHGGSLTGKDILKVVANATYIFDEFAKIFKATKRLDTELSDDDITVLCEEHKTAFLLWDGAFSVARKINPNEDDYKLYDRFIEAAVDCHEQIGCSITPKVHLMLKHVLSQMKSIEGGLGDKMEDWVEQMHQSGQRIRVRFRTMRNFELKAKAMNRAQQSQSHPAVKEQIEEVNKRALTKRRSNDDNSNRKDRVERRMDALRAHEANKKSS